MFLIACSFEVCLHLKFHLNVCLFARFQVYCKVMPLLNFAIFELVMDRHGKKFCGIPKAHVMAYLAHA